MPKKITTTTTRVQAAPKRRRKQRRQRTVVTKTTYSTRRRRFRYVPRSIPAVYGGTSSRNHFNVVQRGTSMIVSGHCLLSSTYGTTKTTPGVFWSFPINPAYWTGTTISRLAAAYNNYKPLRISVKYEPYVGTSTPGLVVFGTIWQRISSSPDDLLRALKDSNGGFSTQAYRPYRSTINLRSLQPSYYIPGDLSDTLRNPFQMVCMYTATDLQPGNLSVDFSFRFDNPGVVANYTYSGSQSVAIHQPTTGTDPISYYLLDPDGNKLVGDSVSIVPSVPITTAGYNFGPGTVLDYNPAKATLSYEDDEFNVKEIFDHGATALQAYVGVYRV